MEVAKDIQAYKYPNAKDINPDLHRVICENSVTQDKGALMTQWDCFNVKEFQVVAEYAKEQLIRPTKLVDLWGQVYRIGHHQSYHNHVHVDWAFVYYVNTPQGSSPIVFRNINIRIKPITGMMIIFPGHMEHYVPPNRGDGRSIVAGNLVYT